MYGHKTGFYVLIGPCQSAISFLLYSCVYFCILLFCLLNGSLICLWMHRPEKFDKRLSFRRFASGRKVTDCIGFQLLFSLHQIDHFVPSCLLLFFLYSYGLVKVNTALVGTLFICFNLFILLFCVRSA